MKISNQTFENWGVVVVVVVVDLGIIIKVRLSIPDGVVGRKVDPETSSATRGDCMMKLVGEEKGE